MKILRLNFRLFVQIIGLLFYVLTGKKLIKDRNPKPNQRLVPNPEIQVPAKDPFFETK